MNRRIAVIDIFGSVYDLKLDRSFIYPVPRIDSTTFFDKIVRVYRTILETVAGGRKPIGISITIDGLLGFFGEEAAMKILERNLALKMKAREISKDRPRPINIILLYKEWIPARFEAWFAQYAEHIIEFRATDFPGVERMIVRKSLLPEFTPSEAEFRFKHGDLEIRPL